MLSPPLLALTVQLYDDSSGATHSSPKNSPEKSSVRTWSPSPSVSLAFSIVASPFMMM